MFAEEMRVANLADRLGFVSKDEMELAAGSISASKLNFIIPIPSFVPCSPRPIGTPPRLLIVASGNRGNQRNVNWFLTEVLPIMSAQAAVLPSGDSGPTAIRNCYLRQRGGFPAALANARNPRPRRGGRPTGAI